MRSAQIPVVQNQANGCHFGVLIHAPSEFYTGADLDFYTKCDVNMINTHLKHLRTFELEDSDPHVQSGVHSALFCRSR